MTENALTPQQTFEENIKQRLREDIGQLLPDDILSEMVKRSVEDLFFTKTVDRDYYGRETVKQSWFLEEVEKLMRERMREQVAGYFEENRERLMTQISEEIVQFAPKLLARFAVDVFRLATTDLKHEIVNEIRSTT